MACRRWIAVAVVCLGGLGAVAPAGASTFFRVGLDSLVAGNETIVFGEAVSADSHWNDAGTFIVTDVRVSVSQVLKGRVEGDEITVTVPGGKVGELTSIVVGGAQVTPGKWYVLFLDRLDLLGSQGVLAVRDHGQGAFDVETAGRELRAFSQGRRHELLPDGAGKAEAVGGARGMPLAKLLGMIRELAGRQRNARPEVK